MTSSFSTSRRCSRNRSPSRLPVSPMYSFLHNVQVMHIMHRKTTRRLCTERRLGDRFRERLRDVEKDDKDTSKPVARHFNLPNHSKEHMSICGLSLHQGTTESRKNLEQRFIFQIGTLNPHGINERFSFN